jgi:hypothetical protein
MLAIQKSQKNRTFYECTHCDYNTSNKFDYEKHINTIKHKNAVLAILSSDFSMILSQKSQKSQKKIYVCCNCNKEYKDNSGLWKHKKKCNSTNTVNNVEVTESQTSEMNDLTDFMKYLMKENTEMKNMMMEVIKNGTHNNVTNTNSHNKTFNLQLFLNETCKDAMNIMDFVESVKVQLSDLEKVGEIGYVDGISNIIVKNLKALDVEKRPVHCTDSKREILYIKDDNKWEKEEQENTKIRNAIKHIAHKNSKLITQFKEKHPDCNKSNSKKSDQYNKLIIEAMGGTGDNDYEKEDKIIKNVAKEVIINKEKYLQ